MKNWFSKLAFWRALPIRLSRVRTASVSVVETDSNENLMPFDPGLPARVQSFWMMGQHRAIVETAESEIAAHPMRAELSAYVGAAYGQLGDLEQSRSWFAKAYDSGLPAEKLGRILLSGVHQLLAKSQHVVGRAGEVSSHFRASLELTHPNESEMLVETVLQSRFPRYSIGSAQSVQQGNPTEDSSALIGHALNDSIVSDGGVVSLSTILNEVSNSQARPDALSPRLTAELPPADNLVPLGLAWSGNTVNTVIFRHHGVLTLNGRQTTAFYVDANTLRFAQRSLATGVITYFDLPGSYNVRDAHNSISLGHDRDGYLHVSYDHHASQLHYRRSLRPNSIDGWTDEMPMTGIAEQLVTYPTFILPSNDRPLLMLYRDGRHDNGSARVKRYDEASGMWSSDYLPVMSGSELKPWTSNPYWNHPAVGKDGSLHLSFVWRTRMLEPDNQINNLNVCYAVSRDAGLTWFTSRGLPYALPITQANVETVHATSPGDNLINQCSMAVDSQNRPHIVFYANDANGVPQYQHTWFDGKRWHCKVVSDRSVPFMLQGAGTLRIPISRPDLVMDDNDNVYMIARSDHTENHLAVTLLQAPFYEFDSRKVRVVYDADLGYTEPVIDRTRWAEDRVLTVFVQHSEQPNGDRDVSAAQSPVGLLDVRLQDMFH